MELLELNCGMCRLQSDIVGIECREQLGCVSRRVDETGGCLVGFPGVVVLPWVSVPRCGGVDVAHAHRKGFYYTWYYCLCLS